MENNDLWENERIKLAGYAIADILNTFVSSESICVLEYSMSLSVIF